MAPESRDWDLGWQLKKWMSDFTVFSWCKWWFWSMNSNSRPISIWVPDPCSFRVLDCSTRLMSLAPINTFQDSWKTTFILWIYHAQNLSTYKIYFDKVVFAPRPQTYATELKEWTIHVGVKAMQGRAKAQARPGLIRRVVKTHLCLHPNNVIKLFTNLYFVMNIL
jgi:hypothetical protein